MHCHVHPENKAKHHTETDANKPNKKQNKPPSSDVTVPVYGWKRSIGARGDSLVSSRYMQNDILCAMLTQAHTMNNPEVHVMELMRNYPLFSTDFQACMHSSIRVRGTHIPDLTIRQLIPKRSKRKITKCARQCWFTFGFCPSWVV